MCRKLWVGFLFVSLHWILGASELSAQQQLKLGQGGNTASEQATYSFDLNGVLVQDALRILARNTPINLVYTPEVLDGIRTSCKADAASAESILQCILKGTNLYAEEHISGVFIIKPKRRRVPHAATLNDDFTISGFITDNENGERLIGATIVVLENNVGTVTNNYGFYSLTLPADTLLLRVSYLGYESQNFEIALFEDIQLNVSLESNAIDLEGVEVVAEREGDLVESTQMSTVSLPIAKIKQIPALLGESDVLKALQLMPGVQSGNEGSSGLYVRGGGPDQNLILLDGAPVYNASHIFGFFSVFNPDALQHVQLTKGGFPARYGGRLSSVLDISMKEGNLKKFQADGALGLIFSKLTLQGPLMKNKMSFLVSGRRTYVDVLARPFLKQDTGTDAVFYFGDLNAKLNYIASPRNRFYASFYSGIDAFGSGFSEDLGGGQTETSDARLDWGNVTGTMRWNHLFSDKLFANTTVTYSKYKFDTSFKVDQLFGSDSTSSTSIRYHSGIDDISAKIDFDYLPTPDHAIRYGGMAIRHRFNPGVGQFTAKEGDRTEDFRITSDSTEFNGAEFAAYVEDDWKISNRLKANLGIHASGLKVDGAFYKSIQPRIALRYLIRDDWSAKASFGTMQQYLHLLSNSGVGLPTDLWVAATDRIPPQEAWQAAVGITHVLPEGGWEFSAEGYYKNMDNMIEYLPGAVFIDPGEDWQDKVAIGKGWAYGAELFVQKKVGRTTGWIGYTLSWAKRQFDELNEGDAFPYRYDRRHDISVVVTRELSERWSLGATWVYGTGNAITLTTARYGYTPPNVQDNSFGVQYSHFGKRNSFRMAPYHRMDLSLQRSKGRSTLAFSVYNVYNRKNPFFYYARNASAGNEYRQVSLFPILPSVTWSFKY